MASRNKATFNDPVLPPTGLMGGLFYPLFATVFLVFNLLILNNSLKDHLERGDGDTQGTHCASHRGLRESSFQNFRAAVLACCTET